MGYQPPFLFYLIIQSIVGGTMYIKKYYNISAHFNKWPLQMKMKRWAQKKEREN